MIGRWKKRGNHLATARLAVYRHLPWPQRALRWLAVALLILGSMYGTYRYGIHASHQQLIQDTSFSEAEVVELRQRLTAISQQLRLETATRDTLSRQLQQYQTDNGGLREQVAFYESLLTKTDRAPGLAIDTFRSETLSPGHYRLKAVLVQGQSSQEPFRGEVEFRLTTERAGRRDTQIWPARRLPIKVARYGVVETETNLPPDTRIQRVDVRVFSAGENNVKLTRSYEVKG